MLQKFASVEYTPAVPSQPAQAYSHTCPPVQPPVAAPVEAYRTVIQYLTGALAGANQVAFDKAVAAGLWPSNFIAAVVGYYDNVGNHFAVFVHPPGVVLTPPTTVVATYETWPPPTPLPPGT